jgi:UDP-N-acetylmuramoyl-L-alanyl-D-glutamate--2,6-diaminopimelate ligase
VIVVLGAGGDRDPGKREPMGRAAGAGSDFVVVTTDNPRSEDPVAIAAAVEAGVSPTGTPYTVELDRRAAIAIALAEAGTADLVVIAGKGHETGQERSGVVTAFDDRLVAAELLAARAR